MRKPPKTSKPKGKTMPPWMKPAKPKAMPKKAKEKC